MKAKICGITRLEDARLAQDLGAWALGFIFYPKSVRKVTPAQAAEIIDALPARADGSRPRKIGVFVDAKFEEILAAAKTSGIDLIQLHGNETPALCAEVAAKSGLEVIKAVRPVAAPDLAKAGAYKGVHALLVDAAVAGEFGGTGKTANWTLAREMKRHGHVVLAGGLNADNIQSAISATGPYAVDASSGLEASPGIKDHEKLRKFFAELGDTA